MEISRVNPIGILERPLRGAPRPISRGVRALASIVLVIFTLATVITTVVSLDAYCLTTEPGDVRHLPTPLNSAR
ncbi:MAG TPA: hypothetical protein VGS22_06000 [Thermoanaerobaculia bacterium]|jgi:hypothetical protein|nr:hypothetical protein [Thermoanaerobaculia bacterium]